MLYYQVNIMTLYHKSKTIIYDRYLHKPSVWQFYCIIKHEINTFKGDIEKNEIRYCYILPDFMKIHITPRLLIKCLKGAFLLGLRGF